VPTVREIMQADAVSVRPEDDVEAVLRVMSEGELPGVPVVNEGGRCVGIVTESDLVIPGEDRDLHLPHYVSLFGGIVFLESMDHFEERVRKAIAARAEDMMTADPVTIDADADVRDAARVIADTGHNRLPVVEHGRYVGIVTRLDVLSALTR
jgi:CBS domain-containing protein